MGGSQRNGGAVEGVLSTVESIEVVERSYERRPCAGGPEDERMRDEETRRGGIVVVGTQMDVADETKQKSRSRNIGPSKPFHR